MIPSLSRLASACIAMLLCAAPASVTAQEVRKVKFRTLCLAHAGELTELALPAAKASQAPVPVPLYTAALSHVIEGSFATPEAIFHGKTLGADGKPVVAAKVPLAKSAQQLFFFVPAKEGSPQPYEILAFDDDTSDFKLGHIRAINLAPTPVRFTLGDVETPEIAVGQSAIFPQAAKKDEFNMYPVTLSFPDGPGKWRKVYNATWKASDKRREIVVTFVDEKFKQPTVKIYSDSPPWIGADGKRDK